MAGDAVEEIEFPVCLEQRVFHAFPVGDIPDKVRSDPVDILGLRAYLTEEKRDGIMSLHIPSPL
jgi:hypothetical protein